MCASWCECMEFSFRCLFVGRERWTPNVRPHRTHSLTHTLCTQFRFDSTFSYYVFYSFALFLLDQQSKWQIWNILGLRKIIGHLCTMQDNTRTHTHSLTRTHTPAPLMRASEYKTFFSKDVQEERERGEGGSWGRSVNMNRATNDAQASVTSNGKRFISSIVIFLSLFFANVLLSILDPLRWWCIACSLFNSASHSSAHYLLWHFYLFIFNDLYSMASVKLYINLFASTLRALHLFCSVLIRHFHWRRHHCHRLLVCIRGIMWRPGAGDSPVW